MASQDPEKRAAKSRERPSQAIGPFVFRSLLADLPLSAEGDRDDIEINCVEFLGTVSQMA